MFFEIVHASYEAEFTIHLIFQDGSTGSVDLSHYIEPDTVFVSFNDTEYFKDFCIEDGTLVWGDGNIDFAPERLYERANGKRVKYSSHRDAV